MTHNFEWDKAPAPWSWVGPAWRREVARIIASPMRAHGEGGRFWHSDPAPPTTTAECPHCDWAGARGRLDEHMLRRHP